MSSGKIPSETAIFLFHNCLFSHFFFSYTNIIVTDASLCPLIKCVLNEPKSLFADRLRHHRAYHKLGSQDYCWHCMHVLNKGKSSVPGLFNWLKVFLSIADKFSSNSTLDSSGISLSFHLQSLLHDIHITGHRFHYHLQTTHDR